MIIARSPDKGNAMTHELQSNWIFISVFQPIDAAHFIWSMLRACSRIEWVDMATSQFVYMQKNGRIRESEIFTKGSWFLYIARKTSSLAGIYKIYTHCASYGGDIVNIMRVHRVENTWKMDEN